MRRFLALLPAIAALLFGLDQIGVNPIAPGPDLGFTWESRVVQSQRILALNTDHGDLNVSVRLQVRCQRGEDLAAMLSDGTPLAVSGRPARDGKTWFLEISRPQGSRLQKFAWPSGLELFLRNRREPMQRVTIVGWWIYTEEEQHDSEIKELRRNAWFVTSIALLLLTALGVLLKGEAAAHSALTPELCIALAIDGVEGSSTEETEKLRALLRKIVLEGAHSEDALTAVAQGDRRLWFKARRQLRDRLDHVVEALWFYRGRL